MTEDELLTFLMNNFVRWNGKPKKQPDGSETHFIPMGDIQKAIYDCAESFSPRFVMQLFSLLQFVHDSEISQADTYGRFYNDPEKTLDELKREHALKGFHTVRNPSKGGRSKKKESEEQQAREYWERWQATPALYKNKTRYIRDMVEKLEVSETTLKGWVREWKKTGK